MSSFKRKDSTKQSNLKSYPGTRLSPASSSTINTSTGVTSLDDILGGGLPLSCSLVIAAPDLHSSYGELVQKYFIAEGLACGHCVCVVDEDAEAFIQDIMWYARSTSGTATEVCPTQDTGGVAGGDFKDDEEEVSPEDRKVKIAWRYENMKNFQTTIATPPSTSADYCHVFDLTSRINKSAVDEALHTKQLTLVAPVCSMLENDAPGPIVCALRRIEQVLQEQSALPVRVCVPSLGSPTSWGDITAQISSRVCFLTLSPQLSSDNWGGIGWLQKVGWLTDASVKMTAFSADPSLSDSFPAHHGFVHILSLPSPSTIVAPSDRFSTLRGLSSSAGGLGGSGENNLAFKCTRKRLIFETLHLDLEGGVSERRTSAPSNTAAELTTTTEASISAAGGESCNHHHARPPSRGLKIDIEFEAGMEDPLKQELRKEVGLVNDHTLVRTLNPDKSVKRTKKKVAFFSDRPDVYDF
ncbi:hypothetical protein NMY22_g2573 [Coprinellus aureogranulatus]|nr:hypothetical protein NMY22_g2573 [Coprinellus aureogranulatus]